MSVALALLLIAAPPPAAAPEAAPTAEPKVHVIDEKEAVDLEQSDNVRLSLPTEDEADAWRAAGIRVQLGYGYTMLRGLGAAWSFHSNSAFVRTSVRLDDSWALGVSMTYGTGPSGLRWNVAAEPTLFPWRALALTVGLGYSGLLVSDTNRSRGRLAGPAEAVSRNLAAGEKLQSCSGSGYAGTLRAEYLFALGGLSSTGPFVEGLLQWTGCTATFGRVDPETGTPVVLTQWWQQQGLTLGWAFEWR